LQPNTPQSVKPAKTLIARALPKGSNLSDHATELDVTDKVSDIFLQHFAKDDLHIIVQRPDGGYLPCI
jgi:hypothetical protein